jgi:hypothetical protein
MSDNTNTVVLNDTTTPTFIEMLARCGLTPEQWRALDEPRKQEWIRVWNAEKAGANG